MDERHSPWWWYVAFIFLPSLWQRSLCSSLYPHGYVMGPYLSCCYYRSSTAANTGCKDRWYWGLKYVSSLTTSVIFCGLSISSVWFGKTVLIDVALSKTTLKYWSSWIQTNVHMFQLGLQWIDFELKIDPVRPSFVH